MLRIISLNLNGIRSAWSKNVLPWAAAQQADVICLQELKAQAADLSPEMRRPDGMHVYYHCAEKKGYSGVGIWSRREPDRVVECGGSRPRSGFFAGDLQQDERRGALSLLSAWSSKQPPVKIATSRRKLMTDTMSPEERSRRMALVRSVDTKPEMALRRLVHGMGYRYRLHCRDLAGKPDLVFRSRRAVIFVHGCFWHRHEGCPLARLPKSRRDFWTTKLEGNRERDARKVAELKNAGWRVFVVWECELKDLKTLAQRLRRFLDEGEA